MPRPQKIRKLCNPPHMKGFKPFGTLACKAETIQLTFEEYESIKLINYDMLSQEQAAEQMAVSRPTITRIYNKALKTIAEAFVEGKVVLIEGGNYKFEKEWFRCRKCYKLIEGLENHERCKNCSSYNSDELVRIS